MPCAGSSYRCYGTVKKANAVFKYLFHEVIDRQILIFKNKNYIDRTKRTPFDGYLELVIQSFNREIQIATAFCLPDYRFYFLLGINSACIYSVSIATSTTKQ